MKRKHRRTRAATEGAEPQKAPAKPQLSALEQELELIRAAQAALKDDRPQAALDHLAAHRQAFASGVLAQERQALGALAHCALGDPAPARVFLAAHPASPHAPRIEACLALLTTP